MANRQGRRGAGNSIRGPQSALTDFLASHNISAQQINLDYQARIARQQAEQAAAATPENDENEQPSSDNEEDAAERKKRKRKEEKAIAKLKQSKEFKKRKFTHQNTKGSDAEETDDDALAREMLKKPRKVVIPKPGQFANCELCEKRFTVTPYTVAGDEGGLLCTKCGKEFKADKAKADKAATKEKAKPVVSKARKRQQESNKMEGNVAPGARSLKEHCVNKIANVVNDIEEFGDLPQNLLDRLSQILSKNRVLTPRTLQLFLQPGIDRIAIYDCAKLETEDFQKIFAFMPDVERVDLRFAGQMKNESLYYMTEKLLKLKHLQLDATNLVSDAAWIDLFTNRGEQLESLKLSALNDSFNDDTVEVLANSCPNLKRLKLRSCTHTTERAIDLLSSLSSLEHLSLSIAPDCSAEKLVNLINSVGRNLKTLSLEDYYDADDSLVQAIKDNCTQLTKLRLTGSASCTDKMFASLFTSWCNPALRFVDLSSNRDLDPDMNGDDDTEEDPVGFGSASMKAMMLHSGSKLERLDLHSNRQIGKDILLDVFDGEKQYTNLADIDLSFVTDVDDVVMNGIFKSCPALAKLAVFACFNARDTVIPSGRETAVAVIGLPNAQSAVETVGMV